MIPSIPGLTTHAIPDTARHDVVYGLAAAQGVIYLSVSNEVSPGVCAFVSAFDTRTREFRKVIDVAAVTGYQPESRRMPHSKIHLSINATPDGRVFAATHFTAPAVGQTSFNQMAAYRGLYEGSWLIEYDACQDRVVSHGCLLPGEGCRISALDPVRECFYLVSYPRNHLFEYQYATHRLRDLGRIGQENPFGIEVAPGGDVYLTDDLGRFLRYSPGAGALEELDLFVPLKPGRRRQGNYVRRATLGMDGAIYGAAIKASACSASVPVQASLPTSVPFMGTKLRWIMSFPGCLLQRLSCKRTQTRFTWLWAATVSISMTSRCPAWSATI